MRKVPEADQVSADKLDEIARRTAASLVDGIRVSKIRAALDEAVAEERKRRKQADVALLDLLELAESRDGAGYSPWREAIQQARVALAAREAKP